MKKYLSIILTVVAFLSLSAFETYKSQECDMEMALKESKSYLTPFSFQDRKTVMFNYGGDMKEYQIQLFNGEEYRFILNRRFAPGVEFEVYNKPKDKKNRKLLYSSKSEEDASASVLSFEPLTIPYVYVDVIIPESAENRTEGCVTIMVGYELVFVD